MTQPRSSLRLAVAVAFAAPAGVNAIEHAISGHVNRMVRFADDGKASEVQQLDNSSSQTRIRWRGTGDIGRGMKAGIYIETGVSSSNSSKAPIKLTKDGTDDSMFSIRHSALSFSGRWGQIRLGQTSTVSDGAAQRDLSGDTLVNWSEAPVDLAGGIEWRTGDGGTITGGNCGTKTSTALGGTTIPAACTVGTTRNDFDGGRVDLLRYDSPKLGPATISAAVWNDNAFDVGAFVDTDLGGGRLALAGAWSKQDQREGYNQWAASASYLFSQGTNITASFGGRDFKGSSADDPFNFWLKLGHKWGNSAVTVGGGQTSDLMVEGADAWDIGVSFVHTLPRAGVELYAGYQHHELDLSSGARAALNFSGASTSVEDINLFVVGSRIKFD